MHRLGRPRTCRDHDGILTDAGERLAVLEVGGRIAVVVVAHLDEDGVAGAGGVQERGPEAFVDEGARAAAVFG